jgi:hypothetical protein
MFLTPLNHFLLFDSHRLHQQKAPGFVEIWVLFFLLKLVYKALYSTERFVLGRLLSQFVRISSKTE